MTYIRHRSRMVQQSVIQDLKDTLIACRWMPGTTSRPVWDPQEPRVFDPSTGQYTAPLRKIITVTEAEILPLLRGQSISVIDYFPEAEGDRSRSSKTPPNTFAVDYGQPSDPEPAELGSSREEQEYIFNFAFYSASDAVALAMFSDLRDRYSGRIVETDRIELRDWVAAPSVVAVNMDADSFRYARNEDTSLVPHEVHLYFGELVITDYIDP